MNRWIQEFAVLASAAGVAAALAQAPAFGAAAGAVRTAHEGAGSADGALVSASDVRSDLTFEDRVRAQEAIERVADAHRIGAARRFEKAVPREALARKVRSDLELGLALEARGVRIAGRMLQDEVDRMVRGTLMPDRLKELFEALHDDPLTIRECLARPLLTERLWRAELARSDGGAVPAELPSQPQAGASLDAPLALGSGGRAPVEPVGRASVLPACADNAVSEGAEEGRPSLICPDARQNATAVWTGNAMIVWGGVINTTGTPIYLNTGGRYDPVTDTWLSTSTVNAPGARHQHSAVWTGTEMIVWGGFRFESNSYLNLNDGGRYDPETDTWTPLTDVAAPTGRSRHTAVWTGDRMLVWGGELTAFSTTSFFNDGASYDPESDSWTPISLVGAPSARAGHTAVWTGSAMIVWGGFLGSILRSTGGRYDPAADHWTPTSNDGPPLGRRDHRAVWTGEEMIVWGGYRRDVDDRFLATGGRYDPEADVWSPTETVGAPVGRIDHTAVWTGTGMVVWGGRSVHVLENTFYDTGGFYDPAQDTWTATSLTGAPSARSHHAAVAAGSRMLIWGGYETLGGDPNNLRDGAIYEPEQHLWTAIDPTCPLPVCTDFDGDGYARCASSCDGEQSVCGDCDDVDAALNPQAVETTAAGDCSDGLDNDCDGSVDAADPGCALPACPDADGDGYAVCSTACDPGAKVCGDCNDGSVAVNPAAQEGPGAAGTCTDSVDNDCDGGADGLDPGCVGPLAPPSGTVIGPVDPIPTFQWNAAGAALTRVVFSDRSTLRGTVYRPSTAFAAAEMWVPTEAQWAAMLKKLAASGRTIIDWGIEIKTGTIVSQSGALTLSVRPAAAPATIAPADGDEAARAGPIPTFRWTEVAGPRRVVLEFSMSAAFPTGTKVFAVTPVTAVEWTPTPSRWKTITKVAGKGIGSLWWRVTVTDAIGRITRSEPTLLGIQ